MVTKDIFRNNMSKFATGVTVITTLDNDGNVHGMTANAFTSVCLDPPTILVCVDHRANTYQFAESRKQFGVNILRETQKDIGAYFARKPEDRHDDVHYDHRVSKQGFPMIGGALTSLGCRVVGSEARGDHTIYIAEVDEIVEGNSGKPLLFFESKWLATMDSDQP